MIGSFWASDNTCEICWAGYQSSYVNLVGMEGRPGRLMRIPLADGTLGAIPDMPADDLIPSFPAASDLLGTGWFGTIATQAGPGRLSPWSATAPSVYSVCWPPSSSARSESSR